jgi:hypothetical protein
MQPFNEFCADVNRLARERCDEINASGTRLFGAHHHDYPPEMLRWYYDEGQTPVQALGGIVRERGI